MPFFSIKKTDPSLVPLVHLESVRTWRGGDELRLIITVLDPDREYQILTFLPKCQFERQPRINRSVHLYYIKSLFSENAITKVWGCLRLKTARKNQQVAEIEKPTFLQVSEEKKAWRALRPSKGTKALVRLSDSRSGGVTLCAHEPDARTSTIIEIQTTRISKGISHFLWGGRLLTKD